MDGGSFESALDRIDVALARLEQAAAKLSSEDPGLRDRHDKLKTSVSQTLEQLDVLISGQG
ncbi:MAG: hypothetical protein KUG65_09285 [Sphingomonadaceae bacterium]|nr:hypothetical protein [Sphingomonadaceae bacterium]